MKFFKRFGIGSTALLAASSAMAAVPTDVTTAIDAAKVDAVTVAVAVFVAIVAIFAIKLLRKAL